ncbi:MAG: hypothetical protein J0L84_17800, partial [Verrucomicrobia bacterium]|nr:hypothetical protein [Verrucomicrobiota bacterium]
HVFPGQLDLVPMGDTALAADRVLQWLADDAARIVRGRAGRAFAERYDYAPVARAEMTALEAGVTAYRNRPR